MKHSVEATKLDHAQFLAEASPSANWKRQSPFREIEDDLEGVEEGKGKLLPTASHLFKLIIPQQSLYKNSKEPPIVFLLHPSQPLSHVSRLIASSIRAPSSSPEVIFRSLTPSGKEFQWSDTTDVADFMRDAAHGSKFTIHIRDQESSDPSQDTVIRVQVPTFAARTRFIRRRLVYIENELDKMEKLKKECDHGAKRGAQRVAVGGFGLLVVYWGAVARLTFWDYGWEVMEPVTYLSGLSTVVLGYLWFLYQGREVSYSSVLNHSISARREALYKSRGLDIDRWRDLLTEGKNLKREIGKIAEDYDQERSKDADEQGSEKTAGSGEAAADELKDERDARN